MRNKFILLTASVALATTLAGCAANQGGIGNKNFQPNSVRYDANGNGIRNLAAPGTLNNKRFANDQMNEMNRVNGRRLNSNNIVGSHKNYKMEMSDEIAKRLVAMNTVKTANVMLTDNNAYIAVSFEDHTRGLSAKSYSRTNLSSPITDTNRRMNGTYGTNGKYGMNGMNGTFGMNPAMDGHSNNNGMRGLSTTETGESRLTEKIKSDIAAEVKRLHPSVQHVYVSANPDFVDRMNSYMGDVRLGHPIQGFVSEFNAMVERIFPANATHLSAKNTKHTTPYIYDHR
ncbi:YhcN/YlaJ family sporulation lipoprotein [Paenibacillus glycanilyticus]|uniref:YhcN/YlaJ family sporulation lipoprotein n=1 Tax=Paenibacillus glycanilyticus TaxID=126569 RepID=UPI002041A24E|nr:YhcN/YlaJ family sporulation lipoprotein [Paenibacillus glycanilyticus]MCM3629014.1 YhcN/YlaJ family sporulation lipoprotein [Paenibacillus glycanilyticus]